LGNVIAKSLSTVFERSWQAGEDPGGWMKGNIMPILKKCRREDPGNHRTIEP